MAALVDTVKTTIHENFGGVVEKLAAPEHQFSVDDTPDQSGKVAVVTGGSEGIGYGIAHTLLSHNIEKLFILSPSEEVIKQALDNISTTLSSSHARKVTWLKLDLSNWKHVPQIASEIQSQTDRLDVLCLTAARGIMTYQLTDYGVDRHMAVNHMGHVILTSHLLPLLKETASASKTDKVRIVAYGSNAHQGTPSSCNFASLEELNQDLGPNGQYGRSKLAQMLYARWLSGKLGNGGEGILVNSVHPGFVETKASTVDIHEAFPVAGYAMSVGMKPFKKDVWEGCGSGVFCATKTEKSGQYICPPAIPEEGSSMYQDDKLMEQLMVLTEQIIKEKTRPDSVEKGCPFKFY